MIPKNHVFILLHKAENQLVLKKVAKKCKKTEEKFGVLNFCRTFAIPKQSGGGEMVDTLL